jgi:hypothetical protein
MNLIASDPVIDEIREVRHRISADCGHDPAKLVEYLMQYQQQFRDRLLYDPLERAAQQGAEPDREQAGDFSVS